jgi:hypothetical protein
MFGCIDSVLLFLDTIIATPFDDVSRIKIVKSINTTQMMFANERTIVLANFLPNCTTVRCQFFRKHFFFSLQLKFLFKTIRRLILHPRPSRAAERLALMQHFFFTVITNRTLAIETSGL